MSARRIEEGSRVWFETPDERRWVRALSGAAGLHLALLVLLGLLTREPAPSVVRPRLESAAAPSDEVPPDAFISFPAVAMTPNPDPGGSATRSLAAIAPSRSPVVAPPTPSVSRRSLIPAAEPPLGASLLDAVSAPASGEADSGNGLGEGAGDGVGDGDGQGFFGITSPGRSFVYVVDASSSMTTKHDSEAKTRFGRVKVELVRSIGTMTPQQGFYVVFFNSQPHPMPARGLQPGLPDLKHSYLDWVARQRPGGDTNPTTALELALALQPDVIYFLTDGVLPRGQNVLRRITGLNRGRCRIHTFAFGSRSGENLMRELATRNGGEYHFVP